jgi:uncharacterized protein YeaO (DUF488 family)
MAVRIVRLGLPGREASHRNRAAVPPRNVPKREFAARDFPVWLPNLAPSEELLKAGQERETTARAVRPALPLEMKRPEASRVLTCWPPCPTSRTLGGCTVRRRPLPP